VPERRVARRARRTRPLSRSQGSLCGLCGPRRLRRDHRQPLRDVTAPGRPFDRGCAEINARIATAGSLSIRLSGGCVFLSISFPPLSSAYASAYIPPPHPPPHRRRASMLLHRSIRGYCRDGARCARAPRIIEDRLKYIDGIYAPSTRTVRTPKRSPSTLGVQESPKPTSHM